MLILLRFIGFCWLSLGYFRLWRLQFRYTFIRSGLLLSPTTVNFEKSNLIIRQSIIEKTRRIASEYAVEAKKIQILKDSVHVLIWEGQSDGHQKCLLPNLANLQIYGASPICLFVLVPNASTFSFSVTKWKTGFVWHLCARQIKKAGSRGTGLRCFLVGQGGVEPPTLGFSVRCSTCWATDPHWCWRMP